MLFLPLPSTSFTENDFPTKVAEPRQRGGHPPHLTSTAQYWLADFLALTNEAAHVGWHSAEGWLAMVLVHLFGQQHHNGNNESRER